MPGMGGGKNSAGLSPVSLHILIRANPLRSATIETGDNTMKQLPPENENGDAGDHRVNLSDLYEKMSGVMKERLEQAGTFTEDVFELALKESREWAEKFREHYAEDIARVSDYIRRDWYAAIRFNRGQTRRSLNLERLQVGILGVLATLAKTAGEQLEVFAGKIDGRLTYKTGEIAGAGNLQCTQCKQTLTFDKAARIPPCPKCRHTVFRRSF